jgi:hypothetical protein
MFSFRTLRGTGSLSLALLLLTAPPVWAGIALPAALLAAPARSQVQKYPPDHSTARTKNQSAQYKSERDARAFARQKVGASPVEVAAGKLRSRDGRWQYRAKPTDLTGHGPGDAPHIHIEHLDPVSGEVLENWHLRWSKK